MWSHESTRNLTLPNFAFQFGVFVIKNPRLWRLPFSILRHQLKMGVVTNIYAATSSKTTSGWREATRNNILAAPVGLRRPCSQLCSVLTEMPSNSANLFCESRNFERVSATMFSQFAFWARRYCPGSSRRRCSLPSLPRVTSHTRAGATSPRRAALARRMAFASSSPVMTFHQIRSSSTAPRRSDLLLMLRRAFTDRISKPS